MTNILFSDFFGETQKENASGHVTLTFETEKYEEPDTYTYGGQTVRTLFKRWTQKRSTKRVSRGLTMRYPLIGSCATQGKSTTLHLKGNLD